jgi:hypothetical protein
VRVLWEAVVESGDSCESAVVSESCVYVMSGDGEEVAVSSV